MRAGMNSASDNVWNKTNFYVPLKIDWYLDVGILVIEIGKNSDFDFSEEKKKSDEP